jgi:hypothetical protein
MSRPTSLNEIQGERVQRPGDDVFKPGGKMVECPVDGCGGCGEVREISGGLGLSGWCGKCGWNLLSPPEPLGELLGQVEELLGRFVVFVNVHQVVAVVLWIAHSHAIEATDVTPYLHINSAEKRSGKSRLLDVLELLVRQAWRVATPTEAVTYRIIERDAPTILLDEVDAIFSGKGAKEHEGLRALLNAGFQRGTMVPRCVGPRQELKSFATFCCKAIAGIGAVPDTVADRSVPIRLRRRKASERVQRFRRREVEPVAAPLRTLLETWASFAVDELRDARPVMPPEITDRAEEAWEPLVAIADAAGGSWPSRARSAAVVLGTGTPDDSEQSIGVRLLADVRSVVRGLGDAEKVPTADLLAGLHALEEAPWGDWYGKPLNAEKLGRTLREYGCRSRPIRTAEGSKRGYARAHLEDAFERYLSEDSPSTRDTCDNPDGYAENWASQPATNSADVAGLEAPQSRMAASMSQVSQVGTTKPPADAFERVLRLGDALGYPALEVGVHHVAGGADGWWSYLEPRYADEAALTALEAAAGGGAS